MSAATTQGGRAGRLGGWRDRLGADEAKAICPVDSWAFRPRYTDGHCPLCGWEPPGVVVRLPLSQRVDTFGWATVAMVVVSVMMLALIVLVYTRS